MSLKGLNLGGEDQNPATPPSGPATQVSEPTKETEKTSESPDATVSQQEALAEEPAARWTCHPIQRYTVGNFHFENGLLVLKTQTEADIFQSVYDSLPIYEQTRLKKIDLSAAEALVRERLNTGGGATKGIDSATGDRDPNKKVGTGSLTGE